MPNDKSQNEVNEGHVESTLTRITTKEIIDAGQYDVLKTMYESASAQFERETGRPARYIELVIRG